MSRDPDKPLEIILPKILLVEGTHDCWVFRSLLDHLKIHDIQIRDAGGKDKFSRNLRTIPVLPNFDQVTSISIVRDADDSYERTLQSICSSLQNAGLPIPAQGQRYAAGIPEIQIFIMPDNNNPGALEDLLIEFARSEPEWACVDSYFSCLKQVNKSNHPHESKARIQAYLSSKREGNLHLGIAASKGYWKWGNRAFKNLREFLLNL